MRRVMIFAGVIAAVAMALLGGGCVDYASDCSLNPTLPCFWKIHGTGTGGSGGSSPECVPSETNPEIEDVCGVFVSPAGSDANGDGTKEKPYRTLGKGVMEGGAVYACADEATPFDERVEPLGEVRIYGGLDCANGWLYDAEKKSVWTAPADTVPLVVGGEAKVTVVDFAIVARDAEKAGGSSIGVLAFGETAEVVLERCDVSAGAGQDGEAGSTPQGIGPNNEGAKGGNGGNGSGGDMNGDPVCVEAVYAGGAGGQNTCGMTNVGGGLGGQGTNGNGAAGLDGQPQPGPGPDDGLGGEGDAGSGCNPGKAGAKGEPGPPGFGGGGVGELTEAGYAGVAGEAGQGPGTPGQGGGGGGGAKSCAVDKAGPGGGGGGAGGCGGAAGTGGKAGGASIGVASVNAAVTLRAVTLTTAKGGPGGQGGDGQQGGSGGNPGFAGGAGACTGGVGGQGGRGGAGGGGAGGHSVGIAFHGAAPVQSEVTVKAGSGGAGGLGGNGTMSGKGEAGKSCRSLDFTGGTCTT